MKILFKTLFLFALVISSCKGQQKESVKGEKFGKEITADNAIGFTELMTEMGKSESVNTKVKAKVKAVCQAKGCWMTLVSDDPTDNSEVFVKFKDYGFFMPMDIAGKEVIIEGRAYKEVTTVEELKHYAEDEGKSAEEIAKITKPEEELKFMADGVIVL
jgi:hypothetical protein